MENKERINAFYYIVAGIIGASIMVLLSLQYRIAYDPILFGLAVAIGIVLGLIGGYIGGRKRPGNPWAVLVGGIGGAIAAIVVGFLLGFLLILYIASAH